MPSLPRDHLNRPLLRPVADAKDEGKVSAGLADRERRLFVVTILTWLLAPASSEMLTRLTAASS